MPKVVCIKKDVGEEKPAIQFDPSFQVTYVKDSASALQKVHQEAFDGVYFDSSRNANETVQSIVDHAAVFDLMPDGIAILDQQKNIIRANQRLTQWFNKAQMVGLNFYEALGNPTIIGPVATPLATAMARKAPCQTTIQLDERFFRLSVVPVLDEQHECQQFIVSVVDCTESVQQRSKLELLHRAGTALADLRPEEIYQVDVEHRVELLKDNILHYANEILKFDVIEIRLTDEKTGQMIPLLSVGLESPGCKQPLFAAETGNGVTGFVAATGQCYRCEDTTLDPLYVDGLIGAKSSLTVPLIYDEKVIGSFNVESPEVDAFTDSDEEFMKSFARDIAVALNTLDLLNAQQTNTALQSIRAIHCGVALPIDEILNDAVMAIDSYEGPDEGVKRRLDDILERAREIKRVIHRVGEQFISEDKLPSVVQMENRPKLKGKRILVIDADGEVRTSAHTLLERYGCIVETAHEGHEAILMVQNSGSKNAYDAIIADIRLPDIGGFDLLMLLKKVVENPPLILMTGFGYDPGHSIVKARQAGLRTNSVLYKPFKLDQLLETVEQTVEPVEVAPK